MKTARKRKRNAVFCNEKEGKRSERFGWGIRNQQQEELVVASDCGERSFENEIIP